MIFKRISCRIQFPKGREAVKPQPALTPHCNSLQLYCKGAAGSRMGSGTRTYHIQIAMPFLMQLPIL